MVLFRSDNVPRMLVPMIWEFGFLWFPNFNINCNNFRTSASMTWKLQLLQFLNFGFNDIRTSALIVLELQLQWFGNFGFNDFVMLASPIFGYYKGRAHFIPHCFRSWLVTYHKRLFKHIHHIVRLYNSSCKQYYV